MSPHRFCIEGCRRPVFGSAERCPPCATRHYLRTRGAAQATASPTSATTIGTRGFRQQRASRTAALLAAEHVWVVDAAGNVRKYTGEEWRARLDAQPRGEMACLTEAEAQAESARRKTKNA